MGQHGECAATADKRRLRAPEHRWAVPGNWLEPTALGVCAARCRVTACVRGTKNNIIISKDRNFKIYYGPFTFDKANSLAPIKSKPRLSYFYIPCRLCRSAILAGLLHSRSLRSHGVPAQCLYPTRFCLTPHIRPVLSILSPFILTPMYNSFSSSSSSSPFFHMPTDPYCWTEQRHNNIPYPSPLDDLWSLSLDFTPLSFPSPWSDDRGKVISQTLLPRLTAFDCKPSFHRTNSF